MSCMPEEGRGLKPGRSVAEVMEELDVINGIERSEERSGSTAGVEQQQSNENVQYEQIAPEGMKIGPPVSEVMKQMEQK